MASKRARLAVALGVWGAATAGGLYTIAAHGAAPGIAAEAPAKLGAGLRTSGKATLVIAAHPACPCTRATLHELARILSAERGRAADVDVIVLFAGNPKRDHVANDLRAQAQALKGVRVIDDPKQEIAKSLGAHTSGTVLFYDAAGALRFNGGITASRGHEGDNTGADTVRDLIAKSSPSPTTDQKTANTPVYGCSLESKSSP